MFVDWTKDGIDQESNVPVQLQMDSDAFAAAMEAKGVGTDKPVVVSDGRQLWLSEQLVFSLLSLHLPLVHAHFTMISLGLDHANNWYILRLV